jgi:hypothetical protein
LQNKFLRALSVKNISQEIKNFHVFMSKSVTNYCKKICNHLKGRWVFGIRSNSIINSKQICFKTSPK